MYMDPLIWYGFYVVCGVFGHDQAGPGQYLWHQYKYLINIK